MTADRNYLTLIGELAYEVSSLEWLVLGDLGNVLPRPTDIDITTLLGKTTGQMASDIRDASANWQQGTRLHNFGVLAAQALADVSRRRSHVLHARPATTDDGRQLLYRDRTLRNGQRDLFWIDDAYLQEQIDITRDWHLQLDAIRLV